MKGKVIEVEKSEDTKDALTEAEAAKDEETPTGILFIN